MRRPVFFGLCALAMGLVPLTAAAFVSTVSTSASGVPGHGPTVTEWVYHTDGPTDVVTLAPGQEAPAQER